MCDKESNKQKESASVYDNKTHAIYIDKIKDLVV